MKNCIVIGIAGGSASGKSTFAKLLVNQFPQYNVKLLAMDSYFKQEEHLPLVIVENGNTYRDYNCPESFELCRMRADIQSFKADTDILIIEGLLTLWDEDIRSECHIKVFVDCPADIRIVRRIKRNMGWGLSLDDITDVYLDLVRFRHNEFVEPSKQYADIIIDSSKGVETEVKAVKNLINTVNEV